MKWPRSADWVSGSSKYGVHDVNNFWQSVSSTAIYLNRLKWTVRTENSPPIERSTFHTSQCKKPTHVQWCDLLRLELGKQLCWVLYLHRHAVQTLIGECCHLINNNTCASNNPSTSTILTITIKFMYFPFSALTPLIGRQEGHPACKKLDVGLLTATIWMELCISYSSSCHHHLHNPVSMKTRTETFWYQPTQVHLENGR